MRYSSPQAASSSIQCLLMRDSDPKSLDQAYRALAGLTEGNKLVGIISHVSDLKDRIDKQIVVTKTGGMSTVRIEA